MGHRDIKTTLIYADYAPSAQEKAMVESAFRPKESEEAARVASGHGPAPRPKHGGPIPGSM